VAAQNLLTVLVDWARDGTWTTATDDVSTYQRGTITASYGRDQSTSSGGLIAGRGTFELDNRTRRFSPQNASSPLAPNVLPARPALITRTVGATTYTVFRGHTDDQDVTPDLASKRVTFNLVDFLADFRGVKVTTALLSGVKTGAAIGAVLDAVGWTAGRDIDTGATTIPYFWANNDDAADLLQQLVASEGPPSLVTIDASGAFVFRDRHHRFTRAASTSVQSSWRGAEGSPEPRLGTGFSYTSNWAGIVNAAQTTVSERAPTRALTEVWSTDETVTIPAGGTWSVTISTTDPFFGAVTPDDTDLNITYGAVLFTDLSQTSGTTTTLTITPGVGFPSVVIDGLRLRAYSLPVVRSRVVSSSDSASQAKYGVRSLPSGVDPVWASYWDAQALMDLYVASRKNPVPLVTARFNCHHTQTARLDAVLKRNLSDRVAITEPETGLSSAPFFIEAIAHTIQGVTEHEVIFTCEAAPATPTSAFILGTSTLDGATPLGY
jgi:hypothetical protein